MFFNHLYSFIGKDQRRSRCERGNPRATWLICGLGGAAQHSATHTGNLHLMDAQQRGNTSESLGRMLPATR